MNIFQQVFASVDPKASQLVKASENVSENIITKNEKETTINDNPPKVKKAPKKEKKIKASKTRDFIQIINTKPKIDYKPPSSQVQINIKTSASVIPVSSSMRKVQKTKNQNTEPSKKVQPTQQIDSEPSLTNDEIMSQIKELEQKYEELSEQYNSVSNAFNKSQIINEKLSSQNFELEMEIQKLKETTKESNNRLLELKQDYQDKAKERDESWEFKVNELIMELEVMKDSKK